MQKIQICFIKHLPITSALLFRISDMSEQVLTECLKIIENLIAKLPDDFNYASSNFEHIYYNTTTYLAKRDI